MRGSRKMRKVVEGLAAKYGFNLEAGDGSELILEAPPYMDLHIVAYFPHRVRVMHVRHSNGDAIYDPDIQFWKAPMAGAASGPTLDADRPANKSITLEALYE